MRRNNRKKRRITRRTPLNLFWVDEFAPVPEWVRIERYIDLSPYAGCPPAAFEPKPIVLRMAWTYESDH